MPDSHPALLYLDQPPVTLFAWVLQRTADIDCGTDWQDLAYRCSSELTLNDSLGDGDVESLLAATVLIYDRLAEACSNSSDQARFVEAEMSARIVGMKRLGPQAGHPVRDPAILEQRFFEHLDLTYQDASAMQRDSLNLSTTDFLRLNTLKDRVRLMKSVQPQQLFQRSRELERWYGLLGEPPNA